MTAVRAEARMAPTIGSRHPWNQKSVPINAVISKLSSFGTFPANYQFGSVRLPRIRMWDRRGRSAPPSSSCCGERENNQ
jgi:hypothetical protein